MLAKKCCLVIALASLFSLRPEAQARLGEDINRYKAKATKAYAFKAESTKGDKKYYQFVLKVPQELKQAAPEFSGGLTITASGGKIVGQSMVLSLGKSLLVGKAIAVRYALDFAFESLGRSVPKTAKSVSEEVKSYTEIINKALAGEPQNIRYPKVKGKITVTRQADGNLVMATTPD
jgi:hypothetical protein